MTAALLGETTDALLGGRELHCSAGESWDSGCAAGWERTTLLDKRELNDGWPGGWDDGCATG
jgi:hypothetical protein